MLTHSTPKPLAGKYFLLILTTLQTLMQKLQAVNMAHHARTDTTPSISHISTTEIKL